MPATPRPRGFSGASSSSGRPSTNTPMSERQQMALLMQMTSPSNQSDSSGQGPARSRDRNERGETPMHVAAIKGDQDAIKKLLDQGMNPNDIDFAGWTPLHEACSYGHYNVATVLVKAGANVNAKGFEDNTPLHDAATNGNLKLVKMLYEKGADPCLKNRKGKTPIDVAGQPVYNFLLSVKDSSSSTNRTSQQLKKPPDTKKSSIDDTEDSSASNTNPVTSASMTKEDDDIYEFKSTPKDTTSSDDKSDSGKNSDKSSSDEKSSADDTSTQTKRPYTDVETTEDGSSATDDENKRKKRKDADSTTKESNKNVSGVRGVPPRQDKSGKVVGPTPKSVQVTGKLGPVDRKSPCPSPKPVSKTTDSDAETDGESKSDNFSSTAGPKVPPLKIVIPQQNATGDQDTGSRNGKNTSARSHAALPYVVASSNSGNDSTDKDSSSSRCASPADSTKASDDKSGGKGVAAAGSAEERAQQRVLRSSHRSGGSTGQTVDRSSNNSSPQLQSSSPSPAPSGGAEGASTSSFQPNNNGNGTGSPANQAQTNTESETSANAPSPSASSSSSSAVPAQNTVELHPRKRKIRASKEDNKSTTTNANSAPPVTTDSDKETNVRDDIHLADQPVTNCVQTYLNIRKQIERRQRNLIPVQPKPPQGFKDYLMNRCSYVLSSKTPSELTVNVPANIPPAMKDIFQMQEKERHKVKMQHIVEKEKLVLAVEQEILRVHGRAARALANQSLPFSVCTILKDEEVYNMITPEQEEKDRNARSRYNGRLFLSWLQDVDDKWEKIKESMLFRHHNEVESLHAVQKMDWEWKMKELMLCEFKAKPVIDDTHVPMVHVSDDFDLLPA